MVNFMECASQFNEWSEKSERRQIKSEKRFHLLQTDGSSGPVFYFSVFIIGVLKRRHGKKCWNSSMLPSRIHWSITQFGALNIVDVFPLCVFFLCVCKTSIRITGHFSSTIVIFNENNALTKWNWLFGFLLSRRSRSYAAKKLASIQLNTLAWWSPSLVNMM